MTRIYADMKFLICLIIKTIASVKISVIRVIRVQKYLLRQPPIIRQFVIVTLSLPDYNLQFQYRQIGCLTTITPQTRP